MVKFNPEKRTVEDFKKLGIKPLKPDLGSSSGLYSTAVDNGLQEDADNIISMHTGEKAKEIFSGGFISDVFDIWNSLDYGVVGMLKGEGFAEGVKKRSSFSDKDALGANGLPGVIAGIVADIAVDPLTYVTPWKIFNKIPVVAEAVTAGKKAAFGALADRTIETGALGTKTFKELEGGTTGGKWLAEKFVWMFGADPIFKETMERKLVGDGRSAVMISELIKPLAKFDDDLSSKLITRGADGRINRVAITSLQNTLSPEDFEKVAPVWNKIDELGQELVDLGVLSKSKYEENLGNYFHNAYTHFEEANKAGLGLSKKLGIKGTKSRVEGLTTEKMAELGQIESPAYLAFKTMLDMSRDVENAKLFRIINKNFASDIAQEGFVKLPETARLSIKTGEKADILSGIKNINESTAPIFKDLEKTFAEDKSVLSEIAKIKDELENLSGLREEELFNFLNEGAKIQKATKTARKIGTIPEHLQLLANQVKRFNNINELKSSKVGIEVEKLFENGDLERAGFNTIENFFDSAKGLFKPATEGITEKTLKGNIPRLIELQKRIENLAAKSETLATISKKSIDDSFRSLEKQLSDFSAQKDELLEQLDKSKLGDLAGKYVPKQIHDYIQEIVQPAQDNFGKKLIGEFKFMKVVLSPGTHARNIVSNRILNWWKLGINPLNVGLDAKVYKAMREGANNKYIKMATEQGYGMDTFATNELRGMFEEKIFNEVGKTAGLGWWKKAREKISSAYQSEENYAKLAAFINQTDKGLSPAEAWKAAESATFNYSQVTPFVRKLRTEIWGAPFITFPLKATPVVVETLLKHPARVSVFGKIKRDIENLIDEKELSREQATEPQWIKDGFYIKLPFKDKLGRSAYFDLTYIIPFGDLMSGQFINRQIKRETGLKESSLEAVLSKNPALSVLKEFSRNQDFRGNKIWNESDSEKQKIADMTRHLTKTFLPPMIADQIPGGYNTKGERQLTGTIPALKVNEDNARQQQTLMENMLKYVGAKVQPIDVEIQEAVNEADRKKALRTMLMEKGIISGFEINYIPKEKK